MRAENPGTLKIKVIFRGRVVAGFVLIFQPEAQELAPIPGDVWRDPVHFLVLVDRVLSPVEAAAGVPVAIQLLLHPSMQFEKGTDLVLGDRRIDNVVDRPARERQHPIKRPTQHHLANRLLCGSTPGEGVPMEIPSSS